MNIASKDLNTIGDELISKTKWELEDFKSAFLVLRQKFLDIQVKEDFLREIILQFRQEWGEHGIELTEEFCQTLLDDPNKFDVSKFMAKLARKNITKEYRAMLQTNVNTLLPFLKDYRKGIFPSKNLAEKFMLEAYNRIEMVEEMQKDVQKAVDSMVLTLAFLEKKKIEPEEEKKEEEKPEKPINNTGGITFGDEE